MKTKFRNRKLTFFEQAYLEVRDISQNTDLIEKLKELQMHILQNGLGSTSVFHMYGVLVLGENQNVFTEDDLVVVNTVYFKEVSWLLNSLLNVYNFMSEKRRESLVKTVIFIINTMVIGEFKNRPFTQVALYAVSMSLVCIHPDHIINDEFVLEVLSFPTKNV